MEKVKIQNESKTVCFKHLRYEVSERNGDVAITIEKRIKQQFSFWVQTYDGTAIAGEDYLGMSELITMQANEAEREIKIGIVDDPEWEPDEDFTVILQDPDTRKQLPGDDTLCTVLILDEDKPGNIGFKETQIDVRRKDRIAYITLVRKDGSDGRITCTINTTAEIEGVPGKKAAVKGKDFIPIEMK